MNKNRIVNLYYKRQVTGKLRHAFVASEEITEVVVNRISNNEWKVKLKVTGNEAILYTKRNLLRTFCKLESAASYLKLLGVSTFTVEQYDQQKDSTPFGTELIDYNH